MPTQLISNVMNTQVHTHTQYPYDTGVSLNSGRITSQNVLMWLKICLICFDVKSEDNCNPLISYSGENPVN